MLRAVGDKTFTPRPAAHKTDRPDARAADNGSSAPRRNAPRPPGPTSIAATLREWANHKCRSSWARQAYNEMRNNRKDNEAILTVDYKNKILPTEPNAELADFFAKSGLSYFGCQAEFGPAGNTSSAFRRLANRPTDDANHRSLCHSKVLRSRVAGLETGFELDADSVARRRSANQGRAPGTRRHPHLV